MKGDFVSLEMPSRPVASRSKGPPWLHLKEGLSACNCSLAPKYPLVNILGFVLAKSRWRSLSHTGLAKVECMQENTNPLLGVLMGSSPITAARQASSALTSV